MLLDDGREFPVGDACSGICHLQGSSSIKVPASHTCAFSKPGSHTKKVPQELNSKPIFCSDCRQCSQTWQGSPDIINLGSIFTVTSVASRCCRILFLMGGLHFPHQKVEALATCTPKTNACLHDSVYQMYFKGMSALGDIPVHDGIKWKNN